MVEKILALLVLNESTYWTVRVIFSQNFLHKDHVAISPKQSDILSDRI